MEFPNGAILCFFKSTLVEIPKFESCSFFSKSDSYKFLRGIFFQVAIPIIPTIRVVVTFNKFEELANSEEFGTPLSSPAHFSESKGKENNETSISSSGSWLSWIKGSSRDQTSSMQEDCIEDIDPFVIPTDYSWIDSKEKKRRSKAKKAKNKNLKKPTLKPKELDGEVKE